MDCRLDNKLVAILIVLLFFYAYDISSLLSKISFDKRIYGNGQKQREKERKKMGEERERRRRERKSGEKDKQMR